MLEYAGAAELKIARFVSIAGVQLGVYGDKAFVPSWLVNITTELAWAAFYTPFGQQVFSAAGYCALTARAECKRARITRLRLTSVPYTSRFQGTTHTITRTSLPTARSCPF